MNRVTALLLMALLALAGCAGTPQDDRYQTHRNASWDNFRA